MIQTSGGIQLTPEQAKEAIHIRCEKRIKEMRDKGCDPICVEATITRKGKAKDIGLRLLPIIITPERFEQFISAYGGEYMYDEIDKVHRRIFWLKPNSECKTIRDLFALHIEEIYAAFNRLDNKKTNLTNEGGILLI